MDLIYIFSALTCLISSSYAVVCPEEFQNCTCQQNTLTCSLKNYWTLPESVTFDLSMTYYHFDHNNISKIEATHFINFISMSYLSLRENRISTIDEEAFHNNLGLTHIDLSKNLIEILPINLFKRLIKLQNLYIGNNRLQRIETDHFTHLTTLQVLRMNDNKLSYIGDNAFINSHGLRELYLESNLLEIPNKNWLQSFNTTVETYYVYLDENPWSCDCRMKDFYLWGRNHPWFNKHDSDGISVPKCHSPAELRGISLSKIPNVASLECKDVTVSSRARNVRTTEGQSIELSCSGEGYPYPTVSILKQNGQELISSRSEATLKIPKVQLSDSGTYICNASGYNQNTVSSFKTISIKLVVYRTPGSIVTIVLVSLFFVSAGLGLAVWQYRKKCGPKAAYGRLPNNTAQYDASTVAAQSLYNAESIHHPPTSGNITNTYNRSHESAESSDGEDVVAEYSKDTEFLV